MLNYYFGIIYLNLPLGSNAFYYFMDSTAMNKFFSGEEWVEARKALRDEGIFYVKVAMVATLAVMILAAAPSALNLQQRSIAQELLMII
jgi:hypothetical protein